VASHNVRSTRPLLTCQGRALALALAASAVGQAVPTAAQPVAGPVASAPASIGQPPLQPVSLPEALMAAYRNNPDIGVARAQLRATDEGVPIARAQGLPSLQAAANFNHFIDPGLNNPTAPQNQFTAQAALTMPIYQGGSVANAISAAKQRVASGRHDLDSVGSNVFAQVVAAYLAVIRDEAVVGLNQKNVDALATNLKATDARFQKGDLTKTDVAQSSQRLELARAQLVSSQIGLDASRERYVRLVGAAPGVLAPPQPLVGLPMTADEAVETALRNNPDLLSADAKVRAANYDTRSAKGQRLPRLAGVGTFTYNNYFNSLGGPYSSICSSQGTCFQHDRSAQVGAQMTLPLFQGGGPAAQVRAAQARESASLENANAVNRAVVETTRAAFYAWRASSAVIAASENAVAAAEQSLAGVRAENKIGTRTIIDLLNAEQELLSAQVQLVSARRDAYVAAFNLLTAMGQAQPRNLGIDQGQIYDPTDHYRRVAGSIWDWGSDPAPVAKSTTTTLVPIQDGLLR